MDKAGPSTQLCKRKPSPNPPNPRNAKEDEGQNIKVVVRIRPMNERETRLNSRNVLTVLSRKEVLCKDKKYKFDQVFKPTAGQIDVYLFVVSPMVMDVLGGFNCTVFAYGQTGTGKTYTMTGGDPDSTSHWTEDEHAGCIPRAVANIFAEIEARENVIASVRVSYLELYCEEAKDLLAENDQVKLIIQESKSGVVVNGLQEISVFSAKDVYDLLDRGNNRRKTAATSMNNKSSRSHTVFTIIVHMREMSISGEDVVRTGKLNLVDLAGSESVAKAGLAHVKETGNINRSLLTLSRVIQKLSEKNPLHAPFRDSKLTRILKDSLGGSTKTCIIATVSPASDAVEETLNTLEYATDARCIKNRPTVNEKVTKQQIIKKMNDDMAVLQKELDAARSAKGFFVDPDNYNKLQNTVKTYSTALVTKESLIQEKERQLAELQAWKLRSEREFDSIVEDWAKMAKKMKRAKLLIIEQRVDLKKEKYVAAFYEEAAKASVSLLKTTEEDNKSTLILKEKLDQQYAVNMRNRQMLELSLPYVAQAVKKALDANRKLKNAEEEVSSVCHRIDRLVLDKRDEQNINLEKVQKVSDNLSIHNKKLNDVLTSTNEMTHEFKNAKKKLEMYEQVSSSRYETVLIRNTESLNGQIVDVEERMNVLEEQKKMLDEQKKMLEKQMKMCEEEMKKLHKTHTALVKERDLNEDELKLHKENSEDDKLTKDIKQSLMTYQTKSYNSINNVYLTTRKVFEATSTLVEGIQTQNEEMQTVRENLGAVKDNVQTVSNELNSNLSVAFDRSTDILRDYELSERSGDTPQVSRVHLGRISDIIVPRENIIQRFQAEFEEDALSDANLSILANESIDNGPDVDSLPR